MSFHTNLPFFVAPNQIVLYEKGPEKGHDFCRISDESGLIRTLLRNGRLRWL